MYKVHKRQICFPLYHDVSSLFLLMVGVVVERKKMKNLYYHRYVFCFSRQLIRLVKRNCFGWLDRWIDNEKDCPNFKF